MTKVNIYTSFLPDPGEIGLGFFSHPLGLPNLGEFQEFFLHPTPAVRHKVIFLK